MFSHTKLSTSLRGVICVNGPFFSELLCNGNEVDVELTNETPPPHPPPPPSAPRQNTAIRDSVNVASWNHIQPIAPKVAF